jgi:hypothetical protein
VREGVRDLEAAEGEEMFTIVHKRNVDGFPTEEIFQAVTIQHVPPSYDPDAGGSVGLHLLCGPGQADGNPSVKIGTLRDGTAFVMNDRGATVATYCLDGPKHAPPQGNQEPKRAA